jgi:hypothetical protein
MTVTRAQKELRQQEAVAELMAGILTKHEVLAVKKRPEVKTEADFSDLSLIPYFYGNPVGNSVFLFILASSIRKKNPETCVVV